MYIVQHAKHKTQYALTYNFYYRYLCSINATRALFSNTYLTRFICADLEQGMHEESLDEFVV